MRQLFQNPETGRVEIIDVPAPALLPRTILVRNEFSVVSPGTESAMVAAGRDSYLKVARSRPDLVRRVVELARREGVLAAYRKVVVLSGEVTSRIDHLGFQCDSRDEVDRIAREGERLGILVHPPTDTGGSVGYWTMVRDPDGHGVEFTCGQPIAGLE